MNKQTQAANDLGFFVCANGHATQSVAKCRICGAGPAAMPKRSFAITDKPSKYGNERTVIDGLKFDSKAEARYYKQLKVREAAGEITAIMRQVRFRLGVEDKQIAFYKADFVYLDMKSGLWRVIDVKGVETDVFKLKRKMMRSCLGLEVELVKVEEVGR